MLSLTPYISHPEPSDFRRSEIVCICGEEGSRGGRKRTQRQTMEGKENGCEKYVSGTFMSG